MIETTYFTFTCPFLYPTARTVSNLESQKDRFKKLAFIVGEWDGKGEGFDTGKESDITNRMTLAYDPSPGVITGRFEARRSGKLENQGMMIFLYDPVINKFIRKTVYSYGFLMNEVGELKDDRFVFDCVGIDAEPDYWKGLRIRTYIEKHSDDDFSTGLETASKGEEFKLYGQNRFHRRI